MYHDQMENTVSRRDGTHRAISGEEEQQMDELMWSDRLQRGIELLS